VPLSKSSEIADVDPSSGGIMFGDGALAHLESMLIELSIDSLLLIVDQKAYAESGAKRTVMPALSCRRHDLFSDFQQNPVLDDVVAAETRLNSGKYDGILAIGGGSAIDVAKTAAVCAGQASSLHDLITGRASISRPGLPVIAVPTTAGTGAEVTQFAAIYVDGVKHSISHPGILPCAVLVDPLLTHSMPPSLTAATGLDALCQAIESFWSVASTEKSRRLSRRAIELAINHLEDAVLRPTSESRTGMSLAAHLAGQAINITKTTAAHALSYTLTTNYGVPHGMAVAISLSPLLRYNHGVTDLDCTNPHGVDHVRTATNETIHLLGCQTIEQAVARIERLLRNINCPVRLSEVGVKTAIQRRDIASRVNAERLGNNPRQLDTAAIVDLLESIR